MKRFLKTLALLMASLFVVGSGMNAALDRMTHSPAQNSYTVYDEQGTAILAYRGDLSTFRVYIRPERVAAPTFLHRT